MPKEVEQWISRWNQTAPGTIRVASKTSYLNWVEKGAPAGWLCADGVEVSAGRRILTSPDRVDVDDARASGELSRARVLRPL